MYKVCFRLLSGTFRVLGYQVEQFGWLTLQQKLTEHALVLRLWYCQSLGHIYFTFFVYCIYFLFGIGQRVFHGTSFCFKFIIIVLFFVLFCFILNYFVLFLYISTYFMVVWWFIIGNICTSAKFISLWFLLFLVPYSFCFTTNFSFSLGAHTLKSSNSIMCVCTMFKAFSI